jgi:hypothetical protein
MPPTQTRYSAARHGRTEPPEDAGLGGGAGFFDFNESDRELLGLGEELG